jgi:peptidyl-prolyl cis-trans isomerase C
LGFVHNRIAEGRIESSLMGSTKVGLRRQVCKHIFFFTLGYEAVNLEPLSESKGSDLKLKSMFFKGDFMKRFRIWHMAVAAVIICGIALMPLMAIGEKEQQDGQPENAAVVNGKAIPFEDFKWELELYKKRLQAQGMQVPEHLQGQVQQEVINDLINRELIYQDSVEKGISVKPEQVEKELEAIRQRYPDKAEFEAILGSMNMSEAQLKDQIAQRSAITTLIEKEIVSEIKVGGEEAEAFYKENPHLFERPEEVHARHILIKVEASADQKQKEEARKKIEAIKKQVDAGEAFDQLAKEHSDCPSAQNGGDLGYFSRGKMVPPFEAAAFALEPGKVSDIVETDFGYHLIQVVDRREAGSVGFEEVRPQIETNLRNEKIQTKLVKYLEQLHQDATIETFVQ